MELNIIRENLQKFQEIKSLADKSISRLSMDELVYIPGPGSLSMLAIMHHMAGNMISRWTGFPEADGEKTNRNRDQEFEEGVYSVEQINELWDKGWQTLFDSIGKLNDKNLQDSTFIRSQELNIHQAILRQMSHLSYHVGQLVFLAKLIKGETWESLSIPKGQSETFNTSMKAKFK